MSPAQPNGVSQCQEKAMSLQQSNFIGAAENSTGSHFDTNFGPAAGFRSIFAAFLDALHQSRRLKADRVIHHHRHLIADNACAAD